jgi:hypothetical protein
MTDENKKKFRINQNLVLIVFRGDSETENAKMLKLLSKTLTDYSKNKFSEGATVFAKEDFYPKKAEINGTLILLKVYRNSRAELRIWPSSEQLMKFIKNNSFTMIVSNREKVDY